MVPTLETERLTMRAWRQTDFEPFAQFYADPALRRLSEGPATEIRPGVEWPLTRAIGPFAGTDSGRLRKRGRASLWVMPDYGFRKDGLNPKSVGVC